MFSQTDRVAWRVLPKKRGGPILGPPEGRVVGVKAGEAFRGETGRCGLPTGPSEGHVQVDIVPERIRDILIDHPNGRREQEHGRRTVDIIGHFRASCRLLVFHSTGLSLRPACDYRNATRMPVFIVFNAPIFARLKSMKFLSISAIYWSLSCPFPSGRRVCILSVRQVFFAARGSFCRDMPSGRW